MKDLITIAAALTVLLTVNVLTTQWGSQAAVDAVAWLSGAQTTGIAPGQVVQLAWPEGISVGKVGTLPLAVEDQVCPTR